MDNHSDEHQNVTFVKYCRVCGDKALGFNFNGLTCDPCKAFFRRTAQKYDHLKCANSENCPMDKTNRKKCRRCRLDKCFSIGMKKGMIYPKNAISKLIKTFDESYTIRKHITNQSVLNSYEIDRLNQIQKAGDDLFHNETNFQIVCQLNSVLQVLNQPGLYVRKIIKFCKTFPAFKCLKASDQLIMLKCFFPEKISISVSYKFEVELDGWSSVENENGFEESKAVFVRMDTLRQYRRQDIVSIFNSFVLTFHDELDNDPIMRDLILVILLFKPRPNLTCHEFIRYNHIAHCYLLQRYLEHKFVGDRRQAARKLSSLLFLLNKIDYLSALIGQLYAEFESRNLLLDSLTEIFNL